MSRYLHFSVLGDGSISHHCWLLESTGAASFPPVYLRQRPEGRGRWHLITCIGDTYFTDFYDAIPEGNHTIDMDLGIVYRTP